MILLAQRLLMKFILNPILCWTFLSLSSAESLQVQGHRGARSLMPENTIPSFESAIQARAHVLELDLYLTSDLECVIHHDFTLNKNLCTYLDGSSIEQSSLIKNLTLAEVKQIDAGGKVNLAFPKQAHLPKTLIPTLQELFQWVKESSHPQAKKICFNLEIKRDPRFPEWTETPKMLAEKIITLVEENGFSDRTYYSSFDPEVLQAIRAKSPTAEIGFIFNEKSLQRAHPSDLKKGLDLLIQLASSLGVKTLSPDHRLIGTTIHVGELQQKGFQVIPWTVNDPTRWEELNNLNVNGIITDDPEGLISFIENADIRTQMIK